MISVEDKIDIFTQELVNQLNDYKEESLSKTEQENLLKEEKADLRIKTQNESIKKRFQRMENKNVSQIVAEGKTESRDLVLETKKELRNDFNDTLIEKINQILKTPSYRDYLKSSLNEVNKLLGDSEELYLFVSSDERELFNSLTEEIFLETKINYKDLLPKYIGGFIVHDQDNRVSYDFSLNNLLLENNQLINNVFNRLINGEIN